MTYYKINQNNFFYGEHIKKNTRCKRIDLYYRGKTLLMHYITLKTNHGV